MEAIATLIAAALFYPFLSAMEDIKKRFGMSWVIIVGTLLSLAGLLMWLLLFTHSSGPAKELAFCFGWVPAILVIDVLAALVWVVARFSGTSLSQGDNASPDRQEEFKRLYKAGKRDFSSCQLSQLNLSGLDLSQADLRSSKLVDADLNEADLQSSDLRGADLRGAVLRNANLRDASLHGADLTTADLRGADLRGAELTGATVRDAIYSNKTLWPKAFYGHKVWGAVEVGDQPHA